MAKVKLTQGMRERLSSMATKSVNAPAEQKALNKAYSVALPLALKVFHARFPVADMEVLRRYQVGRSDRCIRLNLTAGGVVEFCFNPDDAPYRPDNYSCRSVIFAADERLTKAFNVWQAALDAHKKAIETKRADYSALISGSRFLEEVEAIWPDASCLRDSIVQNLPATLTPDAIERIRADVAQRAKAA